MKHLHLLLKNTEKHLIDNSPGILTGIGVAGSVLTAVLTGKSSVKAADLIREEWPSKLDVPEFKDKVKLVWTLYIPPVGVGALTIVSIVAANRIGARRAAAIAAAYSLSERAFTEYRDKVVERMGEGKERAIRDDIAQDQVRNNPLGDKEVIIVGSGKVRCYESHTGRYFMSDMETLRKAENTINHKLLNEGYVSLTDLFELIGLGRTDYSEEVGWKNDTLLELRYSAVLSDDDQPCISINYRVAPIRDYYRFS